MSKLVKRYLGFDCGNSSIRTVVGSFNGECLELELINKVPNMEYRAIKYDHWDILAIFHELLKGMKLACDKYPDIESFGISTWGIDFGLLGISHELLGNPLCYRNALGQQGMESLSDALQEQIFMATGIQNLPMNTLYQLLGIRQNLKEYYTQAELLLLMPDLLNFLFTGELNSEISIASTTQLLNMRTRTYSNEVLSLMDLNPKLFVPLVSHGQIRGKILPQLSELYNIPCLQAVSVPAHDTAAAVVTIPSATDRFAFISSGTWSLIGTELREPLINTAVAQAGYSNEGGAFGTILLLKNSCGMHILQNIKREMEFNNSRPYSWDEIVQLSLPGLQNPSLTTFDPNSRSLYHPESMIRGVATLMGSNEIGRILASTYRSLAISYAQAIEDLERITGDVFDRIHIIGGGARNDHLNQMTADLTGKTIISGPDEATSLGVIAVLLMHDHPEYTMQDIRSIIRKSIQLGKYKPV